LPEGGLVAIQHVNSETGVVQPAGLGDTIRERGGMWLADCAQSAGKLPLPDADLIIVSAHKLGGPPGIGALLVRDLNLLKPTGGQEQGYRGGTENVPAILGFAAALEARGSRDHLAGLRAMLEDGVRAVGGSVVAETSPRLPEIGSYRLPGTPATAQLIELDLAGIAVSAGSACSSGSLKPSPVLMAMGWTETNAREVIRVSMARETNEADIARFLAAWGKLAARRAAA
jgi:cysteine desulfurase